MALEAIPLLYTSFDEMTAIFSEDGVNLRINDNPESGLDSIFEEATDEVNLYLQGLYLATALVDNRYVRRVTSYFACHHLSMRQGNAAQYESKVEKFLKELQDIKDGIKFIPRLAFTKEQRPTVTNTTIDHRHLSARIVKQPSNRQARGVTSEPDLNFHGDHVNF